MADHQLPHWLFAFDAAAISSARLLALLATHPDRAAQARAELGDRDLGEPQLLPYLRGDVHEAVRLWPTTLVVLRKATATTGLRGTALPAGTQLVVVSGYFHRDPATVPHADAFAPEAWAGGRDAGAPMWGSVGGTSTGGGHPLQRRAGAVPRREPRPARRIDVRARGPGGGASRPHAPAAGHPRPVRPPLPAPPTRVARAARAAGGQAPLNLQLSPAGLPLSRSARNRAAAACPLSSPVTWSSSSIWNVTLPPLRQYAVHSAAPCA